MILNFDHTRQMNILNFDHTSHMNIFSLSIQRIMCSSELQGLIEMSNDPGPKVFNIYPSNHRH